MPTLEELYEDLKIAEQAAREAKWAAQREAGWAQQRAEQIANLKRKIEEIKNENS